MKFLLSTVALVASVLDSAEANTVFPRSGHSVAAIAEIKHLLSRASPQAPDGYTPKEVDCPSDRPSIRSARSLSPEEQSWLSKRRNNTVQPMKDFFSRLSIDGLDVSQYLDDAANNASALPNIGIAFSGGGWRAMLSGAGAMAAFDSRTKGATDKGGLGGLLQSATYLTGVSGGNWLVGSLAVNNFTSVQAILDTNKDQSGSLWDFRNSIVEGPETSSIQLFSTADYYDNLFDDVKGKKDAGFNTSLTDYWGRGLSFYLVNATDGGPAYTWSSIADDDGFRNGNTPMPLSVSDGRTPGETGLSSLNTTNYEFNPFEMGSWDATVFGFAPMKYVGSRFSGGQLFQNESCIRGFDNVGFIMGTSSSLFNQFILNIDDVDAPSFLKDALKDVLTDISKADDDISDWVNPFYFWNNGSNPNARTRRLTLVDGGEDLQNIGFDPLVQAPRNVDVIFAVDNSADTPPDSIAPNWPNGTSLVATYERYLRRGDPQVINGTRRFPAIPDVNTIVNQGLNTRPTFFGCNSSASINAESPLVIYIPNHPYVFHSNVSTFQLSYGTDERNAIITNGYDVATQANGTVNSDWATCVGCAVLSRSLARTGTDVPETCRRCMNKYCWDGTRNSSTPAEYDPTLVLPKQEIKVSGATAAFSARGWSALAVAAASGLLMLAM